MFGCLGLHYDYSCALMKHVLITSPSVPTGLKLDNVHACKCVCCIVRQMSRGLKTVTSWSVFHRICVFILRFLLYFMLHNGCVTCHIVLTLTDWNLQIVCLVSWLVHCTVYSNTKRTCYQNWICFHHQVTGWWGICWAGLPEGAVRYWFSDWDSSVCQTQHIHLPTLSPKDMNGSSVWNFLLFFEYEMVDKCRALLRELLDVCIICVKKQFPSKQMCL